MLQPETASLAQGTPMSRSVPGQNIRKYSFESHRQFYSQGQRHRARRQALRRSDRREYPPGKGTPVSQIEMRRISDGVKISERYKTTDQVEKATIEDQNFNYLYKDADGFHFMNNDNYDQVQVPEDIIGSAAPYLQENMTVKLSLHGLVPWPSRCRSGRPWKSWKPSRSPRARPHRHPTSPRSSPTACVPTCRRMSGPVHGSWS